MRGGPPGEFDLPAVARRDHDVRAGARRDRGRRGCARPGRRAPSSPASAPPSRRASGRAGRVTARAAPSRPSRAGRRDTARTRGRRIDGRGAVVAPTREPADAAMTLRDRRRCCLFPAMLEGPLSESIPGRIRERGPRRHRGPRPARRGGSGGIGASTTRRTAGERGWSCAPSRSRPPSMRSAGRTRRRSCWTRAGEVFTQARAADLAGRSHLILVCPRYEGIDDRIRDLVDLELSIGDYVLTGGELAALVDHRRGDAPPPGRDRRRVDGRGVVRRRAPRVPAVHPAGRVSAAAASPTCS